MGLPKGMRAWKRIALAGGVITAVLVVTLLLVLCLPAAAQGLARCGGCVGNSTLAAAQGPGWDQAMAQVAALQAELGSVKRSLEETRGRWDSCRLHLDTLQRNVTALEQALALLWRQGSEQGARTAALQEENRELKEELAQQRQQLEDVQRGRSSLQSQISNLLQQLQALQSRTSSGTQPPASSLAARLSLLALAGTLFL
ncbi:fibrinogen- and Ig-binding protein-like [Apteryx mantelli]|uniref:Fibrinogen- and Ig-binding protein-like n=1 Tax=Apteryx mantelli TaxID=2696672 RepID=A0ABM4FVF6_9AVES